MDPHLYFMQLLVNLPTRPANDLDAWLPDRWKQAHISNGVPLWKFRLISSICASRIAHKVSVA
jgi:hypothetical protein